MAALEVVRNMKESLGRHRTTSTRREIEFSFAAPKAKKVSIAGSFNNWSLTSMPMKKNADGAWKINLKLSPGTYEYKYVVDGGWVQEMSGSDSAPNSFGTHNNVVSVK